MTTTVSLNGGVSFWIQDLGGMPQRRPLLGSDLDVDVCIVGGGFSGLWTAYYLATHAPNLQIVVLEKEFTGFGASGRNGGNLSGNFPWNRTNYLRATSSQKLLALELALRACPQEVMRVATAEGIDADIVPSGNLAVATNQAQVGRITERYRDFIANRQMSPDQIQLLSAAELAERVRVNNGMGALYNRNSYRVQPAKLVRGLAAAIERKGVRIFEDTPVSDIAGGRAVTPGGVVRARVVVRTTEGFTPGMHQFARDVIPMNSAMIVTEPLPQSVWDQLGWGGCETVSENSHLYSYCQRTREGRITVGGRGVPYRYGSATDQGGITQQRTIELLRADLDRMFPQARHARIEQAWCGVLGVSRDWCASVGYDPRGGFAWAGGYVGGGLSATNLAGRTLCDLILERDTTLTQLAWVNHKVRRWEPEPLRWLGIRSMYKLYSIADRRERTVLTKTSRVAHFANAISAKTV